MRLHTYKNAQSFLKANQNILVENESSTQLMIYNAIQKLTVSSTNTCFFGTIKEYNKVILLFSNVTPYNFQVFSPINDDQAIHISINILITYIIANTIPIKGISGDSILCNSFITYYKKKFPSSQFKEYLNSNILELRELRELHASAIPDGYFRQANIADLDTITHWNVLFGKDVLGLRLEYDRIVDTIKEQINNNLYYIFLSTDNIPVSMACTTRNLLNGVSISYVYTASNYRGYGYATAIMYHLSNRILDQGKFCTLLVDKNNPVANRVYHKIGYTVITEKHDYCLS